LFNATINLISTLLKTTTDGEENSKGTKDVLKSVALTYWGLLEESYIPQISGELDSPT
jgi:hypothetical protein